MIKMSKVFALCMLMSISGAAVATTNLNDEMKASRNLNDEMKAPSRGDKATEAVDAFMAGGMISLGGREVGEHLFGEGYGKATAVVCHALYLWYSLSKSKDPLYTIAGQAIGGMTVGVYLEKQKCQKCAKESKK